jgi:hypothetical protein
MVATRSSEPSGEGGWSAPDPDVGRRQEPEVVNDRGTLRSSAANCLMHLIVTVLATWWPVRSIGAELTKRTPSTI